MEFVKKTDYDYDLRLFRNWNAKLSYAALGLVLLLAPLIAPSYLLSMGVFVGIYVIAGAGLMLLAGFTGQISLGHAAFIAVGAYTSAVLQKAGVPFFLALPAAGLLAALVGVVVGLPALRLHGIYLAIATLAFAFIIEEIITRWEAVTNGASGMRVRTMSFGNWTVSTPMEKYYVVMAVAVLAMFGIRNLLRSPRGLAMMAVRDSGSAAQSMGINLARTKLMSFAISAALAGLAGAFYADSIRFISPEQFTISMSIELLVLVFIGGIGSMHGIVYGAIFVVTLPQLIALAKDFLPKYVAEQPGLQAAVYGLLLLFFIVVEPQGLYGIWLKVKHYFSQFPFYRKGELARNKTFAKAERW
jgi:branched-chain amino acid transport system permease protein